MLDAHHYTMKIFKTSSDHAANMLWLETLSAVIIDKSRVVQAIEPDQLSSLLVQLQCPQIVIETLQHMIKNRDLKLLPRLSTTYRRKLLHDGKLVVDITTATDQKTSNSRAFPDGAIVLHHLDPELIGGARIVSSKGSYEFSARSMLTHIQSTLQQSAERTQ